MQRIRTRSPSGTRGPGRCTRSVSALVSSQNLRPARAFLQRLEVHPVGRVAEDDHLGVLLHHELGADLGEEAELGGHDVLPPGLLDQDADEGVRPHRVGGGVDLVVDGGSGLGLGRPRLEAIDLGPDPGHEGLRLGLPVQHPSELAGGREDVLIGFGLAGPEGADRLRGRGQHHHDALRFGGNRNLPPQVVGDHQGVAGGERETQKPECRKESLPHTSTSFVAREAAPEVGKGNAPPGNGGAKKPNAFYPRLPSSPGASLAASRPLAGDDVSLPRSRGKGALDSPSPAS